MLKYKQTLYTASSDPLREGPVHQSFREWSLTHVRSCPDVLERPVSYLSLDTRLKVNIQNKKGFNPSVTKVAPTLNQGLRDLLRRRGSLARRRVSKSPGDARGLAGGYRRVPEGS